MALDKDENIQLLNALSKLVHEDWIKWPDKFTKYELHAVVTIPKTINCLRFAIESLIEISRLGGDYEAQQADEALEAIYNEFLGEEPDEAPDHTVF